MGAIIVFIHLFFFQIISFEKKDKLKCLNIFKSNNILGLIILISIVLGKI